MYEIDVNVYSFFVLCSVGSFSAFLCSVWPPADHDPFACMNVPYSFDWQHHITHGPWCQTEKWHPYCSLNFEVASIKIVAGKLQQLKAGVNKNYIKPLTDVNLAARMLCHCGTAPSNDILANNWLHVQQWSHKIIMELKKS